MVILRIVRGVKLYFAKLLAPYFFSKYEEYQQELTHTKRKYLSLNEEFEELKPLLESYKTRITELREELSSINTTPIDSYCESHYSKVGKFAYKDKLEYKGKLISAYPNEMITPQSYVICKARLSLQKEKYVDMKQYITTLAQFVDNSLLWTDDKYTHKAVDRYSYPIQALATGKEDCEAHAHILASLDPNYIGVAFGYAGKTGHAFGVAVIDDMLYIVETNSLRDKNKNVQVIPYDTQSYYTINYIFTQNHTYKVGVHNVHFGVKLT